MNNSDNSLFIESDEEDEEKELHKDEEGYDSDSSDASDEIHQQNKPSSYNTQWPQSYRCVFHLSVFLKVTSFMFQVM